MNNARSLAVIAELEAVAVGTRGGAVYVVLDDGLDGQATKVVRIAVGLNSPNGVVWHQGWLYVLEQDRVIRCRASTREALLKPQWQVVTDTLPNRDWHGWRYGAFGPDGWLYMAIGAPCNICLPDEPFATIIRLDVETGGYEIFARGVRNPVGLAFHPLSGELYFTDNGADHMGDDSPPEELNHAPRAGLHFGYPWYGGGDHRTQQFAKETPPQVTFPVASFGAHVAPLGLTFYPGGQFPESYRNHLFVAQHGSWNRSTPDGYRIVHVDLDASGTVHAVTPFVEGFLENRRRYGRPVDLKPLPDGSLLVSDDFAGMLYRIRYEP